MIEFLGSNAMIGKILIWLNCLTPAFSYRKTFLWFCSVILALILQKRPRGTVQSMINTLSLSEKYYTNMDDMFRSDAIDLQELTDQWLTIIQNECTFIKRRKRSVLISDAVKKSKEGRKMPGVKRLHSESATQSKPTSFHGIQAGAIVTLVQSKINQAEVLSMPIEIRLLDGLDPVADWEHTSHPRAKESLEMQSLHRLEYYIPKIGDTYFVADRASMSQDLFAECKAISERTGYKVDLITNAKRDAVGYEFPVYCGIGRPPIRGNKVELAKLFISRKNEFRRKRAFLYGKHQTIRYYSTKLIWGLKRNIPILFVLCIMEDGRRIILASSDTKMHPTDVIRLYGNRFGSIEEDFKVFKNEFGGMNYRFWTTSMPHLSHFRSAEAPHILESVADEDDRVKVLKAVKAGELYMQSAFIAMGFVKMIAAQQTINGPVQMFTRKRTYTTRKVSEADVCEFIRENDDVIFYKYRNHPIISFILNRQRKIESLADVI